MRFFSKYFSKISVQLVASINFSLTCATQKKYFQEISFFEDNFS